jgi:hypothetical protein
MGGCCGREYFDDKISSSNTLNDLVQVLTDKKRESSEEIQDIYEYLANPYPEHPYSVLLYVF